MKRLFVFLYVGIIPLLTLSAQNLVKDFFKSQSQKGTKVDTLDTSGMNDSILYVDPTEGTTHLKKSSFFKVDSISEHKMRCSIFLLRQDYSLYDKKKKKYYGYDNHNQFGITYSIGLRCKGFNILLDEAIHPWIYDANYKDFQEKRLEPVVTNSHYLLFNDSVDNGYIEMDSVVCVKQTIRENYFYASSPFVSMQDGFTLNTADTCKTGIIVWVVNEDGDIESGQFKMDLKYSIIKAEMFGAINIVPPVASDSVLGGFYLTESGEKDCPYLLSGIAIMRDGRWTLNFPFKGYKFETSFPEKGKKGRLTEIKKPIKVVEKN